MVAITERDDVHLALATTVYPIALLCTDVLLAAITAPVPTCSRTLVTTRDGGKVLLECIALPFRGVKSNKWLKLRP